MDRLLHAHRIGGCKRHDGPGSGFHRSSGGRRATAHPSLISVCAISNQAKTQGKLAQLTHDNAQASLPAISANGSKMAYLSNKSGVRDVWVSDPNGKADEAVTRFRPIGYRPILSPDGKRIVFPAFDNN